MTTTTLYLAFAQDSESGLYFAGGVFSTLAKAVEIQAGITTTEPIQFLPFVVSSRYKGVCFVLTPYSKQKGHLRPYACACWNEMLAILEAWPDGLYSNGSCLEKRLHRYRVDDVEAYRQALLHDYGLIDERADEDSESEDSDETRTPVLFTLDSLCSAVAVIEEEVKKIRTVIGDCANVVPTRKGFCMPPILSSSLCTVLNRTSVVEGADCVYVKLMLYEALDNDELGELLTTLFDKLEGGYTMRCGCGVVRNEDEVCGQEMYTLRVKLSE